MNVETKEPLHISELTDLAYKLAKEGFGSEIFSFSNIWSKVWKSADRFSKEKVESWIGFFYTELLTDPRFVVFSFNKWRLKEFMNASELKKLDKKVFSDDSIFEEEYEAYLASKKRKKEVEVVPETADRGDLVEDDLDVDKPLTDTVDDDIFEPDL